MKSFFKYLLATITGIIIAGILLFFIFIGIITAKLSKGEEAFELKEKSVLLYTFDQNINDRSFNNPFGELSPVKMGEASAIGLIDIIQNLEKAAANENIKGIFLDLSSIGTGIGTVEEIRNALVKFKESGKFIYAYSEYYSQTAYYLASVADKIYVTPTGGVDFKGVSAEVMFYTGFLKKVGVEPQVIRHGKFKSAVEPFILEKLSDENREQMNAFMGSIWKYMVENIAKSRNLSVEQVMQHADNLAGFMPSELEKSGLIDGLKYKDEVYNELKSKIGIEEKDKIEFVEHGKMKRVPRKREGKGLEKDKVAVIYASGNIVNGKDEGMVIASETFAKAIREARTDKGVKAIVLRVNSGGGSALASDVIWREMGLAKKEKPVIVSMGDVAASGGYYIACNADTIVANPTTITGSIGVFGLMFSGKELLNNKLGITSDVVKTNKFSDMGAFSRPLNADEKAIIQRSVEQTYTEFITRVAEGRKTTTAKVDEIGQGRVWSGVNAMELGLIDIYGGLDKAIEIAAQKAKLDKYRLVSYPEEKDPFEQILASFKGDVKLFFNDNPFSVEFQHIESMRNMINNQGVMMQMPYTIDVK